MEEDRYQGYVQVESDLSNRTKEHVELLYAQTDLNSLGYSPSFPPTQGPRGSDLANAFTVILLNLRVPPFLAQNGLAPSTTKRPLAAIPAVLWRTFGWLGNPADPDRGSGKGSADNEA